jgi:two-component sensor histidine kinase/CHASE1-domain containing sensor protein
VLRPFLPVVLIALLGAAATGYASLRTYRDIFAVERLRFENAVGVHLAGLRDHLASRETLARAVAAVYTPPQRLAPDALDGMERRFLALMPDIFSMVWLPRVEKRDVAGVYEALRGAGIDAPRIMGPERQPLDLDRVERSLFPVLDIEPKTAANMMSLGLDIMSLPVPRAALDKAMVRADVAATAPIELVQLPGVKALVLYAPVYGLPSAPANAEVMPALGLTARQNVAGYLGFSFRYDQLLASALARIGTNGPAGTPIAATILDRQAPEAGILLRAGPEVAAAEVDERVITFGGREWAIRYAPLEAPGSIATMQALTTGLVGLALLFVLVTFVFYMILTERRLRAALAGREQAEARLRIVVDELNHRVKNILAVVQAVVGRTLRDGDDPEALRELVLSRLRAMASATTLLSDTEWHGAPLREIVAGSGLPFGDRVRLDGPDMILAPRAAQNLVLIVHELWTNAAKHGALRGEGGTVSLSWRIDGDTFRLVWLEDGIGPQELPDRQGFGRQLIERLAPLGIAGSGRLTAGEAGIRYDLEAPLDCVRAPG